ncbi:MAG: hypothetical protein WCA38_15325 [Candidatus Acidiferrales bacterium]
MNVSKISNGVLLGLTLLVATSGSAATHSSQNKGSLSIQEPVTVNGTRLAVGNYQLKWEGTGAEVELNIIQSHKIVATVPARLVDLTRPGRADAYEARKEDDGSTLLTAIDFSGKKYQLAIGQSSAVTDETTIGSQK